MDSNEESITRKDICIDFDHKQWVGIFKPMWNNHHCVFDHHLKYVLNVITKFYKVRILKYSKQMCEMFELAKYIYTSNNTNKEFNYMDRKLEIKII